MRQTPLVIPQNLVRGAVIQDRQFCDCLLNLPHSLMKVSPALLPVRLFFQGLEDRFLHTLPSLRGKVLSESLSFCVLDGQRHYSILPIETVGGRRESSVDDRGDD
jgi:hypothetical protein